MTSANRLDQFLSAHARNREEVTIDAVEIALVRAGISIDYATRVNDCGTNIYLEGGGILCLYDSGRLLLQGKPTSEETALFNSIIDQSKSGQPAPAKDKEVRSEERHATDFSGSKQP